MTGKIRLGVLGSTRGTNLQAIMDAIDSGNLNAKIVVVGSDNSDAPILERAARNGIRTFCVDYKAFSNRQDAEIGIAKELRKENVDLVLLIGFMKIITSYLINEFSRSIWNLHPSLLPKYAKATDLKVHRQVIDNNEKESGCTLHEVVEEVDAGKIIMQKRCTVLPEDTPESLKEKVQKLEQECILESLKLVSEGKILLRN